MLVLTNEAYVAAALRISLGGNSGVAVLPLGCHVVIIGGCEDAPYAIIMDCGLPASTPIGTPARAATCLLARARRARCPERLLHWGAACGGGGAGSDVATRLPGPL